MRRPIFFWLRLEIRKSYVFESYTQQKLAVLPTTANHQHRFIGIDAARFEVAQENSQELVSLFFMASYLHRLLLD
jgi:hypothetical protein